MYNRKLQEMHCPVLDEEVTVEVICEVSGTGSCQIVSDVVSVSCSQDRCDRTSLDKCLIRSDRLKDYMV